MASTSLKRAAICVFIMLAVVPMRAEAAITSVTLITTSQYENAAGYTYAEIMIHGSVARPDGSEGRYSVPAVTIYPKYGRGNRVGVVDWLNSGFYHFFPPTTEDGTIEFTRLATGSHLFDEGYTYISIQWNKAVTEIFGPTVPDDGKPHNFLVYGSIDRSADAWEILLDAARLLKDPRVYPGGDPPASVATVLSSGYSQGAALQLELLAEGLDPTRVYDGHLIQMIGLTCWKREDVAPHFGFLGDCSELPTSGKHAPVIVLASESDMLAFHPTVLGFGKSAFFTRNRANPNWRQYRDGGDLSSARTNSVVPSPEPEHRRRQAHLPRSVRQPDQVDTRQKPREASRRSLLPRERGRDGCLHPVDGCRWPFRGRGSTTSRRVDRPWARCRCSTRPLRATQSCRARPVPSVRVPRWHLHPVQRRGAAQPLCFAPAVCMARHARGEPSGRQGLHLQPGQESAHRCGRRRAVAASSRG